MRLALLLGLLLPGLLQAAPALTSLTPSGGQRGESVTITLNGTLPKWPVQVWCSTPGIRGEASKKSGQIVLHLPKDAPLGIHGLRVYDDDGASEIRRFVVGQLPEVTEVEPNDETTAPQPIDKLPTTINGVLNKSGDVDIFRVKLTKGQTLIASVDANEAFGSPMDAILQIVSEDGFVIEHSHDADGFDPRIVFTASRDGNYLVRIFCFPAMPDSSIRFMGGKDYVYRLTLTTGPWVDHAVPLAIERAKPQPVQLLGANVPPEWKGLAVTLPQGFVEQPQLPRAIPVLLEPHPTINLTDADAAKRLEVRVVPFTVTSRLTTSVDRFTIAAKKGESIHVELISRSIGRPLNGTLRIVNNTGGEVKRIDPAKPNQDVQLTFNAPTDGEYRIEVRDLFAQPQPGYVYALRVTRTVPEFSLIVTADRFTIPKEKHLDVEVKVIARNGFKDKVTLRVEGLPDDIAMSQQPPVKDAIPLRFTAKKLGAQSAFRIMGIVENHPEMTASAHLKGGDDGDEEATNLASQLWITATAK